MAKHNPVPWFESLTGQVNSDGTTTPPLNEPSNGGTNCDANHVVNLDSPTNGLVADLIHNTVPAFSWITPNNCSDAHDAMCKGNNLSGAFGPDGTPNYDDRHVRRLRPRDDPADELHRRPLRLGPVPRVLRPAHRAVEGLPRRRPDRHHLRRGRPVVHLQRQQLQQRQRLRRPTSRRPARNASAGLAGATPPVRTSTAVTSALEPTGPNSTLGTDTQGDQLYPGPGNNSFIDRPPACTSTSPSTPANCVPGIVRGGSGNTPGARTDDSAYRERVVEHDHRQLHRRR